MRNLVKSFDTVIAKLLSNHGPDGGHHGTTSPTMAHYKRAIERERKLLDAGQALPAIKKDKQGNIIISNIQCRKRQCTGCIPTWAAARLKDKGETPTCLVCDQNYVVPVDADPRNPRQLARQRAAKGIQRRNTGNARQQRQLPDAELQKKLEAKDKEIAALQKKVSTGDGKSAPRGNAAPPNGADTAPTPVDEEARIANLQQIIEQMRFNKLSEETIKPIELQLKKAKAAKAQADKQSDLPSVERKLRIARGERKNILDVVTQLQERLQEKYDKAVAIIARVEELEAEQRALHAAAAAGDGITPPRVLAGPVVPTPIMPAIPQGLPAELQSKAETDRALFQLNHKRICDDANAALLQVYASVQSDMDRLAGQWAKNVAAPPAPANAAGPAAAPPAPPPAFGGPASTSAADFAAKAPPPSVPASLQLPQTAATAPVIVLDGSDAMQAIAENKRTAEAAAANSATAATDLDDRADDGPDSKRGRTRSPEATAVGTASASNAVHGGPVIPSVVAAALLRRKNEEDVGSIDEQGPGAGDEPTSQPSLYGTWDLEFENDQEAEQRLAALRAAEPTP